jgi:thiamine biosynthesis lipoprotein
MKEILLLLIILSNSLLKSEEIQRKQIIMNTFTSITLEKKHRQEFQKGFKLLKSIEKSLSSYDKHALLYQLNQDKKVKANAYLVEAIK